MKDCRIWFWLFFCICLGVGSIQIYNEPPSGNEIVSWHEFLALAKADQFDGDIVTMEDSMVTAIIVNDTADASPSRSPIVNDIMEALDNSESERNLVYFKFSGQGQQYYIKELAAAGIDHQEGTGPLGKFLISWTPFLLIVLVFLIAYRYARKYVPE